jgi:hypothetical protein
MNDLIHSTQSNFIEEIDLVEKSVITIKRKI